jgi:hypothetical protein
MAQVLLHQPADPVAALGSFLVHFADFHEQNVQVSPPFPPMFSLTTYAALKSRDGC